MLLFVIYLSFISLGLPDPLLGAAWPVMQGSLGVSLSFAGVITTIISLGTVLASLLSDRLTKKLGTGLLTAASVALTAFALFGFSVSKTPAALCLFAVPYGLGAGAVDAALNHFVAQHYSSRHMNWLHCFWGVGTMLSPFLMRVCLAKNSGWQGGYRSVAVFQLLLTVVLFASLPLWRKKTTAQTAQPPVPIARALAVPRVGYILLAFFAYCGLESTVSLWAASFVVLWRGLPRETAVMLGAVFFVGITAGRLLAGFVADRLGDKNMIRAGIALLCLGAAALPWLPPFVGLALLGLGCAPIYPGIIHATPHNFGAENAQTIIGIQMASAYLGNILLPPLFGLLAQHLSIGLLPLYLAALGAVLLLGTELLNQRAKRH